MKTLLIILGLAFTGMAVFAKKEIGGTLDAIKSLKYKLLKFHKLEYEMFGGLGITFIIDLQIHNPTSSAINIPAKIKKFYFFLPNNKSPFASVTKDVAIDIPAKTYAIIKDIDIRLDTNKAIEVAKHLLQNNGFENIIIEADIEVAGQLINRLELTS